MARKSNSECWYVDVCKMDNPCSGCIRYLEMKHLMEKSGLPKAKQKPITLYPDEKDYDKFYTLQDYKDSITEHVENGDNLMICGNTGNGKTSWAIKILLKYFNDIWAGNGFRTRGLFVHVPTLLLKLKDFDNPVSAEYKNDLMNADLVVWDEFGTSLSNYDYSQLLMYLDVRLLSEKSNIFTSNLKTQKEISDAVGERIASRIRTSQTMVVLEGRDRR